MASRLEGHAGATRCPHPQAKLPYRPAGRQNHGRGSERNGRGDDVAGRRNIPLFNPEAFAAARDNAGLSRAELAKRLKVDPSLIRQWEGRHRGITAAHLRNAATILGVPPAQLQHPAQNPTLAELRSRACLTQSELAERLEVPRGRVIDWESGQVGLGGRRSYTLRALGLTPQLVQETPEGQLPGKLAERLAELLGSTVAEVQSAFAASAAAEKTS